jgi:hypothetical protein
MNFSKFLDDPQTHCPSPEELMREARYESHADHCIRLWEAGKCTWEQALQAALVAVLQDVRENPWRRKKATPAASPEPHPTDHSSSTLSEPAPPSVPQ